MKIKIKENTIRGYYFIKKIFKKYEIKMSCVEIRFV